MRVVDPILLSLSFLLIAGCEPEPEPSPARLGRILVSDGEEGHLHIVDLERGETLAEYELEEPAAVHAGGGRRFGYAYERSAGRVRIIDGGVWRLDHGDHAHVSVEEPSLLDFTIEGVAPVHFTFHDGRSAIFFDGAQPNGTTEEIPASAVVVKESSLAGLPETFELVADAAHHGVAVPVRGGVLLTSDAPPAVDESNPLPSGLELVDLEGTVLQSFPGSCEGLHGEASFALHGVAFACADGILLVERASTTEEWATRTIAYPDGRRAGALRADPDGGVLFAKYADDSASSILRIDAATELVVELALEDEIASFEAVPAHEPTLVVLTTEGSLLEIDADAMTVRGSWSVTEPFELAYGTPYPGLAVAEEVAYVTSPASGEVVEVDLARGYISRRFHVGGRPSRIAVLGPATLADADDHGDEHDD
jgi:hypothetical protein